MVQLRPARALCNWEDVWSVAPRERESEVNETSITTRILRTAICQEQDKDDKEEVHQLAVLNTEELRSEHLDAQCSSIRASVTVIATSSPSHPDITLATIRQRAWNSAPEHLYMSKHL